MTKKYRVVFHSLAKDIKTFETQMKRLGVPVDIVEYMIRKAPLILKQDLTLEAARQYADSVLKAGGRVTIQEHGRLLRSRHIDRSVPIVSFEDFTMCPRCGFKQPKGKNCVRCGGILKKPGKVREPENVAGH
ncbi:MAG: hypothetical protein SV775_06080 [Thermodesulfobacteriota bacterium]|nr:hypothetical protein [Thermodesulfobacteriota bacterium]